MQAVSKRKIIIFRNELLSYSETFIVTQVSSLLRFKPYYVGTKIMNTQQLGNFQLIAPFNGNSKIYRQLFMVSGYILPDWLRSLEAINAKLIHAHFGFDGVLALPLARKLQIPLVVTFHGYDITNEDYSNSISGWIHRVYKRRRRLLFKEAKLVIAVSQFIRSKLIEKGCPENKILVHYIGVDTDKFKPDPIVQREPVVLFVGRLVEKKGCEYLIRAMAQVQTVMPDVELVIIGDGVLRLDLEDLAAKLLRRYKFLGSQPSDIVRSWMNRALLLGMPSVTASTGDSEGAPIVGLEAQAMGLPIVGSIHSGIPEIVVHGETGFLASERDWKTLAEYIVRLLENESLWQQFSRNGQERVRNNFNIYTQTRLIESIYEQL